MFAPRPLEPPCLPLHQGPSVASHLPLTQWRTWGFELFLHLSLPWVFSLLNPGSFSTFLLAQLLSASFLSAFLFA